MFFDGSHRPCVGEEGRPPKISVWEIVPVYGIDVCKKQSLTSCRMNVADDWKPPDQLVQQAGLRVHRDPSIRSHLR